MAKTELFARKQPGGVFLVNREDLCSGNIWFVNSATGVNSVGYGRNPDAPFDTLAYAISQAAVGDRVYLMEGHTEAVIAAGTITQNLAGLEIIGLGYGARRPTITFTTAAAATVAVSGASTLIRNVIFDLTGVDAVSVGINWTGADGILEDCFILAADAAGQAVRAITIGAAAHRLKIRRNRFEAPNDGATHMIYHAGGASDVEITDNVCEVDVDTAVVHNDTALAARWRIAGNVFNVLAGAGKGIVMHANTTGSVVGNHTYITANIAAGGSLTAAAMFKSANYAAELAHVDGSSQIDPAAGGWA